MAFCSVGRGGATRDQAGNGKEAPGGSCSLVHGQHPRCPHADPETEAWEASPSQGTQASAGSLDENLAAQPPRPVSTPQRWL